MLRSADRREGMKRGVAYSFILSTAALVLVFFVGRSSTGGLAVLRSEDRPLAINLNIQAVLELESMEDIVWGHVPDADRDNIIEKWFWDSMGCYQCIEKKEMPAAACLAKYQGSMMMMMGGVINNKYVKECQVAFQNSTVAQQYMGAGDECTGCPICPCQTSGTTAETANITLSAIKRIGNACWDLMAHDPRSKKLIVYELLNMKTATNCVNQPGGSVCDCSEDFNDGIRKSLTGIVSDHTRDLIFKHLVQYC